MTGLTCTPLPAERFGQGLVVDQVDLNVLVASGALIRWSFLGFLRTGDRFRIDADLDTFGQGDVDVRDRCDHGVLDKGPNRVGPVGEVIENILPPRRRRLTFDDGAVAVDDDEGHVLNSLFDVDRECQQGGYE